MPSGREVLETWFRRVWKEEDAAAIDEMFVGGDVKGLGKQTGMTPEDFAGLSPGSLRAGL